MNEKKKTDSLFNKFYSDKVVIVFFGKMKYMGDILGSDQSHLFLNDIKEDIVSLPLGRINIRLPSKWELDDYNEKLKLRGDA
jgi:hypothetical protein